MVAQQSEGRAGPRPGQGITTFSVSPRHRSAVVVVALAQRRGIIVAVERYFSNSPSIVQAAKKIGRGKREKRKEKKEEKIVRKKRELSKSSRLIALGLHYWASKRHFSH